MRSGNNLWGRVDDTVHRVSTPLGSRSKGFIWFFSFLAWFGQQKKTKEPLILLLDEPGLFLHAKAQGDLLRYIEAELKDHHQVMYTSHSPFMVDPHQFSRVRIVEDKSIDSKVPLPKDRDGLYLGPEKTGDNAANKGLVEKACPLFVSLLEQCASAKWAGIDLLCHLTTTTPRGVDEKWLHPLVKSGDNRVTGSFSTHYEQVLQDQEFMVGRTGGQRTGTWLMR